MGTIGSLNAAYNALSIILLQYKPVECKFKNEINRNIDRIINFMEISKKGYPNYDLIVFPESCIQGAGENVHSLALSIDSAEINKLKEKCFNLNIWGHFNFYEKNLEENKKPWNTSIIISNEGNIVLRYHKVNPFCPFESAYPGNEFYVTKGPKKAVFGVMICYDRDFPEVSRELAMKGANILIVANHYPSPYYEKEKFLNQARAFENTSYLIQSSAVGMDNKGWFGLGRSMVVNFDGNIICEAPEGIEYILKADLYPGLVDEARKNYTTQNYLKALKNRGASAVPPSGLHNNPYSVYRDWDN